MPQTEPSLAKVSRPSWVSIPPTLLPLLEQLNKTYPELAADEASPIPV